MSWKYSQSTGELSDPKGSRVCTGFSGRGKGLNNPDFAPIHNEGPIPLGLYHMGAWAPNDPHMGMGVIHLRPDANTVLFGRGGFCVHGLNINDPLASSEGCIIAGTAATRAVIWNSGDRELEVIP